MTDFTNAFGQSDMSRATMDMFGFPSWDWAQFVATNSLSHLALGAIAATGCVAVLYGSTREHLLRGVIGWVLLCGVVVKDFSFDYLSDPEPLVAIDIAWDALSYYAGWALIETNSRIVAKRTRAAVLRLQAMLRQ